MLGNEITLWYMNIFCILAEQELHFEIINCFGSNIKVYQEPVLFSYVQDITNQAQLTLERGMIHFNAEK